MTPRTQSAAVLTFAALCGFAVALPFYAFCALLGTDHIGDPNAWHVGAHPSAFLGALGVLFGAMAVGFGVGIFGDER